VIDGMRVPDQVPLLDSHQRDSVKRQLGSTRSIRIEGGKLVGVRHFSAVADAQEAFTKIREGHLTDGSVGYTVTGFRDLKPGDKLDIAGRAFENKGRDVLRISYEWTLKEDSLTPIGADPSAKVREIPESTQQRAMSPEEPTVTKFKTWLQARGLDHDTLTEVQRSTLKADFDAEQARAAAPAAVAQPVIAPVATPAAGDEKARADELAQLRLRNQITMVAESHGFRGSDFFDAKSIEEAAQKMATKRAELDAQRNPAFAVGGVAGVQVTRDAGDKLLARAKGAFFAYAGLEPKGKEKEEIDAVGGVRAISMKSLLRQMARAEGSFDADEWSDPELGQWASSRINLSWFNLRTTPANKISSGFSNVLANVAHKALLAGLADYNQATYQIWCTIRNSPNFLAVTNANLASGRLTEAKENEAFSELTQKDGGYNSQLGIFGATVSLTWQMIVNDQLGVFMDSLRRAGLIAEQTTDREAFKALLNATWTNDVSASSGLATPANIDKPRAALRTKKSPAGEKMGIIAAYCLHDPLNAVNAQVATGAIYGPGQTGAPSLGSRQIQPVESHWIGDTTLYSGALTTDYYLAGNPRAVDTVLINFLEGIGKQPILVPFDAGAVAAEKYKVMMPMRATIATHTDSAAAARISGMQKAQV
jgi:hypothetical protein